MSPSLRIDLPALSALARELVRTPSVSTREGDVAELTARAMRDAGFDEVTVDALGNVLGRLGQPETGKTLLYDAHMDTVDVGDPAAWKRDPFGGIVESGILYGRGSADMKGALAAMIAAARALKKAGAELAGCLYVAAVVQEEPCEGMAMRHIVKEDGLRPDWVVLGEATNLQISRGQRGRVEFRLAIKGRSCHASAPQRGVNAIYEAARAIVGFELLAPQLAADPFLGRGTIAVTSIESVAGSHNAIPDRCELWIDRRLTIGETEARALMEIRRILSREGIQAEIEVPTYRSQSYTGLECAARESFPYWSTPENEPLLVAAARTIENTLSYVPRIGKWEFSTDGVYTAGEAGIPTIGFGPGEERYAHTVDEQVRVADLAAAAEVYANLALRMLGTR